MDNNEAFEKWAIENKFVLEQEDGEYSFTATRLAWQAWQTGVNDYEFDFIHFAKAIEAKLKELNNA